MKYRRKLASEFVIWKSNILQAVFEHLAKLFSTKHIQRSGERRAQDDSIEISRPLTRK